MTSKKITIFEGPDGAGKTTAVNKFIAATGAKYYHHGAYPGERNIAHYYLKSLRPAMFGEHDIVMDRSWFDEKPYGFIFRGGLDRIGHMGCELFKEVLKLCGGLVIVCVPPWDVVRENYLARQAQEYLDTTDQLKYVYDYFTGTVDMYPLTYQYDYTKDPDLSPEALDRCRNRRHDVNETAAVYLMLEALMQEDDNHVAADGY